MNISELDQWMRGIFEIEEFSRIDNSLNGLQVTHRKESVSKIAFAVDAVHETFRRCAEISADVLVVHHGIFWGREAALTGYHYDRLRTLIENDIALYAIHLPLDAHPELGNNYGMAASLGLSSLQAFGRHKGKYIGVKGELGEAQDLLEIQERLFGFGGNIIRALPFGPERSRTVAIVSGGGAFDVDQAIEEGIDLFITGDAEHTVYHRCLEAGINVIFAGHYLTEVWGVKLLMQHFHRELGEDNGIESEFIDVPTGL